MGLREQGLRESLRPQGLKQGGLRGSLRNLNTIGAVIPDSVVEQFDAQSAFSDTADGTSLSTWNGELGNYSLSAVGAPTLQTNAINGYRAPYFDGTDDGFRTGSLPVTQPFTVIQVILADFGDSSSTTRGIVDDDDSNSANGSFWGGGGQNWSQFAGNSTITTPGDTSIKLRTDVFDGANSSIRTSGVERVTGDSGANDLTGLRVGYIRNGDNFWLGHIGFVEIHDGLPSDGLSTREQEVADKWGITL